MTTISWNDTADTSEVANTHLKFGNEDTRIIIPNNSRSTLYNEPNQTTTTISPPKTTRSYMESATAVLPAEVTKRDKQVGLDQSPFERLKAT